MTPTNPKIQHIKIQVSPHIFQFFGALDLCIEYPT